MRNDILKSDVIVHICSPRCLEAEEVESHIQSHHGQQISTFHPDLSLEDETDTWTLRMEFKCWHVS